jgi:hypothetical protein
VEDGTATFPAYPGYEPNNLEINSNRLLLTANKGIAFRGPVVNNNNQLNTLGVGLQANNKDILIEAVLINPVTNKNSSQTGLWYGTNDKNFVKLVIVNDNTIEFRVENNDVSVDATDRIQVTGLAGVGTSIVKLKLVVSNKTNKVSAYYKIGNNPEQSLGQLNQTYGTGVTLATGINNVSYAGIFSSYRNNGVTFTATYDSFKVEEILPTLNFASSTETVNLFANQNQNLPIGLTASDNTQPTVSLSASGNPTWLKVNGTALSAPINHSLTNAQVNFEVDATGLAIGTYNTTVTASLNGYVSATLPIQLNVNPQSLTFNPNTLNFTLNQGGTTANQNVDLTAGGGNPPISFSVASGGNWLVLPSAQTGNLSLGVNAGGLAPGSYQTTLTASSAGYANAVLTVNLQVNPAPITIATWDYRIDFLRTTSTTAPGYNLRDQGGQYGPKGIHFFGWIDPQTKDPKNNAGQARDYTASFPSGPYTADQLTLNQLQSSGKEANWEMALPNGYYYVKVSAGDPQNFDSHHILNAEGVKILDFNQEATGVGGFKVDSAIVQILDGKLTIDALGGINTKITSILIEYLNPIQDNIPPVVSFEYQGIKQNEGIYRSPLTLKINAKDDGGSGIASIEYSLNGGAYQAYFSPLLFEAPGNYTISARVKDGNNNMATTPHYAFQVVLVSPSTANLVIENLYKFPNADNYTFSFVQKSEGTNAYTLNGPNYQYPDNLNYNHDANIIRVYNRGVGPLVINDLTFSDNVNFKLSRINTTQIGTGNGQTPLASMLPLVIPQNTYVDLTVIFSGRNYTTMKIIHEKMTIYSNDSDTPIKELNLHGIFQLQIESNTEPNPKQMMEALGFKTQTGFDHLNNNHTTPIGDEVFSSYYVRVDASKPVYMRQVAAYHGCCNNTESIAWQPKSANTSNWFFTHHPKDGQTLLPRKNNADLGEATFIPTEAFSIRIAGDNSDPTRNTFTGTNKYGVSYPTLRGVRVWKAIDWNGQIIPNAYFFSHDYLGSGANLDYNDNMYYIENIRPEVGTAFYSELIAGNGITNDPNQNQSSLNYTTTAINSVANKSLILRSLGQVYANGTEDPDITIESIEVIGANLNEFSAALPNDRVLSPGEMVTVNVSFRPQTVGVKNATLLIHYNNSLSPLRIPLYGLATSDCYNLTLTKKIKSAAAINFVVNGQTWEPDAAFRTGNFSLENTTDNTSEILLTDDDPLYRAFLSANANNVNIGYNLPVANGKYLVRLHFAENQVNAPGARVFGINLEGSLVLANYDIFATAGFKTATVRDFEVNVSDNNLTLSLSPVVGRPAIAAMEVYAITSTSTMAMTAAQINGANCGSSTGSIQLSVSNIANGVNLLYKNGKFGQYQSSATFSGLKAGSYTFYAKEDINNGCEIEANFTIPELNNNINFTVSTTPVSCEATSDGTATVSNISGGVAPYTITWNTFPVITGNTATGLPAGNFTTVTVTDANGCAKTQTVVISNTLTCPIRINAAGAAYTAIDGRKFIADQYFNAGSAYTINRPIEGTDDDALYQSERWHSANLVYNVPVVNGNYNVILHFAEIYFNNPGQRRFNVDIEGQRVLTNFDVVANAGARDVAITRSFNANVADGFLNITLSKGANDNPKISAIELVYIGASGNNPPTLATPIPDQVASKGAFFNFVVSEYTFVDSDPGTTLTYTATLANGDALPTWLSFNPSTRTFTGTPSLADIGEINVKVTVQDNANASANDEFKLLINDGTGGTIGGTVSFLRNRLKNVTLNQPSSLQFGPDGKLYVLEVFGLIKALTVQRNGAGDYTVTNTEVIDLVQKIPNYNDDGSPNASVNNRQTLGMLVAGTAASPIIYVSSNDPRTGGGNGDLNLDTNSGTISKLTKNGAQWEKIDLIRGLPKSEHNHATNGLVIDKNTNKLYIAQGGHANKGAPSHELAWLPEYAYSAAILEADLTAIEALPTQGSGNNKYKYDLPTLNPIPGVQGPFGGLDGLNQAVLVQGGPVQIYSPGFRNAYDIVITEKGNMYSWDNSSNAGWGYPAIKDASGLATNMPDSTNKSLPANFVKTVDNFTYYDPLHRVTKGYYAGNQNPTRANPAINKFGGLSPIPNGFNFGFSHGTNQPNGLENNFLHSGRDGEAAQNSSLVGIYGSTNGICEYRASNFNGQMKGNLLGASFNGNLYRVVFNQDGTALDNTVPHNGSGRNGLIHLAEGFGTWNILDVWSQGDSEIFPGSIWIAEYGQSAITILEPVDFNQCNYASPTSNLGADFDSDGYTNGDEIANNTDPCSPASIPDDWDKDKLSDLNDTDDDNDGILDINDAFALDNKNGTVTTLPVRYEWEASSPNAGYILNTGFTGLMINGTSNYKNLYNPDQMTVIGTAGFFTIDFTTNGTSLGTANNQEYGFQFGYNAIGFPGQYQIHSAVIQPFGGVSIGDLSTQNYGIFLGKGDQKNYLKLVVDANQGNGGLRVVYENNDVVMANTLYEADIIGKDMVDLYLIVNPFNNTVQPAYKVDNEPIVNLGTPIAVPSTWLQNVLATGLLSSSEGGTPLTVTWGFYKIEPLPSSSSAIVTINPGDNLEANTRTAGSFKITNNSAEGQKISKVIIDLSTTVFPDMVFDPANAIQDLGTAKGFTIDVAGGAGQTSHTFSQAFNGNTANGYTKLEINFNDFEVGETFEFSVDVDPSSIKGTTTPNTTGVVSGLELAGATVSVSFDDFSGYIEQLYRIAGESGGSTNILKQESPLAPTIQIVDATATPFETTNAFQTVRVNGVVGSQVKVLVLEGGLFVNGVPNNGFDIDPYEANRVLKIAEEKTATIANDGKVDVPITLSITDDAVAKTTGINHILVVVNEPGGRTSKFSNVIKIQLKKGPPVATYRINAAGNQYVTAEGALFAADDANLRTGTSNQFTNVTEIADTEDDVLYQTERWGNTFAYNFPVNNGKYNVVLHFAEIYFGINGRAGVGARRFNVAIEGQPKLTNYDIIAKAGAALKAVQESFLVEVTDGVLNVNFTTVADNAKISAIEIIPQFGNTPPFLVTALPDKEVPLDPGLTNPFNFSFPINTFDDFEDDVLTYAATLENGDPLPSWIQFDSDTRTFTGNGSQYQVNPEYINVKVTAFDALGLSASDVFRVTIVDLNALATLRINAAGNDYTTVGGLLFKADNSFTGGNVYTPGAASIDNTQDDALYIGERWGNFSYNFPINNGAYQVKLHFAEIYFGVNGRGGTNTGPGSRVFHIDAEGQRKIANLDVFTEAGGAMKALTKTFYVNLTDGTLNINFIPVTDNPKISAIEITPYIPEVTVSQRVGGVVAGMTNRAIVRVEVPSVGTASVSSLSFNTTGTSNVNALQKAKLFYTGLNDTFTNPAQLGVAEDNPNGTFTFGGFNQSLADGVNYFWLAYDVKSNAAVGEVLDAQCVRVVLNNQDYTPVDPAPLGNRVVTKTDEEPGKALDLDGSNDFVEIPNEALYDFTNQFTVETWIKADIFDKNWQAIVTKGDNSWRLHRSNNTQKINFAINGGGGADNINSQTDIVYGQWYHLAGVYTGTQLRLYVNGVLEASSNTTSIVNNNAFKVLIGENAQATGRQFNGQIDEVRIWNVARTQQQIRENMHLILRGNETGLVSYWQMNEGNTTSTTDLVNESHGILRNGPTWVDATEPIGWGTSFSANSNVNATVAYTNTGLDITFGATHPSGELVVSRLENINPAGPDPVIGLNKTKSYWVVNNFGNKNGLSPMTLRFYLPGGFLLDPNPNSYKMYKRNSNSFGTWTEQFNASAVNISANYIEFTGITGFSQIIIGGSGVGLPVSLFGLEAKRESESNVRLQWKTATEVNNKGFEIYKSKDGIDFSRLGFVEGAGNSAEIKNYQFVDNQAIGSWTYRLRQIDFDGKSTDYLVRVQGEEADDLNIFPNPISNATWVSISATGDLKTADKIQMELVDTQGNIISSESGNYEKLTLSLNRQTKQLTAGMYLIRFRTANKLIVRRLVINQ